MIGTKAPEFTLYDSNKSEVKLSDLIGKNVVLVFYPLAFSSVCTKELCSLRDSIQMYNQADAEVLGISVDSLFTLDAFKKSEGISFTLLSDFNKDVSQAYDVLYNEFPAFGMKGVSKRAVFVLDKNHIIRHLEVCQSPGDMPDFEQVEQTLSALN
jgi:peroxiredoxin